MKLTAKLKRVDRSPVDPAKWSKKQNPVTRKELGGDFRAMVQMNVDPRNPRTAEIYFDHYDLGDAVRPNVEIIQDDKGIADFGKNSPAVERCKKAVRNLLQRRLYIVDLWGFVPYGKNAGGMPEPLIPEETHRWLVQNAGPLFGGYEIGEQAGRYLGGYAKRTRLKKAGETDHDYFSSLWKDVYDREAAFEKHLLRNLFRNKTDAYRDFRRWMKSFEDGLRHRLIPFEHTNFMHHLCELDGTRILGAELALILINHQVAFAFMRGASRQYGLLTAALPSVWSWWGFSSPAGKGQTHIGNAGVEIGPGKGLSTNLARRIWYLGYMYGLNLLGIEAGYFSRPEADFVNGKTDRIPPLSSLGRLQVAGKKWCFSHPDRGVQYNPVAIMLDFHGGWLAPKHGYQHTGEKRMTWNAFPYERGDHQIDNFFRFVFPGYEEASYHRDERATFVPTPFGDIFDVILDNADPDILKKYQALVVLGDCRISGELLVKLKDYVRQGGDIVLAAENIAVEDAPFYGVCRTPQNRMDNLSVNENRRFPEEWYSYRRVRTAGARIALAGGSGDPLITVHKYGQGRVIIITVDYWMSELKGYPEKRTGLASQRVTERDPEHTFAGRSEFFDQRNWNCPYNSPIKKLIFEGARLAKIEDKICRHCGVECTNDVSKLCDILQGVKHVLADYFASFIPFEIQGPPIHYLVNLTEDRRRIIVTLANHGRTKWKGGLKFRKKGLEIRRVREWVKNKPVDLGQISIAPEDLRILEITADRKIL